MLRGDGEPEGRVPPEVPISTTDLEPSATASVHRSSPTSGVIARSRSGVGPRGVVEEPPSPPRADDVALPLEQRDRLRRGRAGVVAVTGAT